MGLAVRLVSGFLCEFQIDVPDRRADSALHAWIEVFLPGAGWVGIDPTNGAFCDHRFIPTAAGVLMSDIASVEGSYFGNEKVPADFQAKLELELVVEKDLDRLAENVEKTLATENLILTMGGEPTFVPEVPEGAEWSVAAVGPTKIGYAYQFANALVESVLPGAIILYTPGKLYPGEIDPRWALNVLRPPNLFPSPTKKRPKLRTKRRLRNSEKCWSSGCRSKIAGCERSILLSRKNRSGCSHWISRKENGKASVGTCANLSSLQPAGRPG